LRPRACVLSRGRRRLKASIDRINEKAFEFGRT
jgi:hypothetical protein